MRKRRQVFAIVRLDTYEDGECRLFTVKEIVETLAEAEAEVARLNQLNRDKGAVYSYQATRLIEQSGGGST